MTVDAAVQDAQEELTAMLDDGLEAGLIEEAPGRFRLTITADETACVECLVPDNVLEVIDWCLRLDPLERPQSVFALQKAIRDIPPKKRKLSLIGNIKRVLFSEIGA